MGKGKKPLVLVGITFSGGKKKGTRGTIKGIPFGGGQKKRNIKRNSFQKGRNLKERKGIPFGGGPNKRNDKRNAQPSLTLIK